MYRATADIMLPTSLIGSLPRPEWFSQNLGTRTFLQAMVDAQFRDQYTDAVAVYMRDQASAGLDIFTDGDAHYDTEVGGQSWTSYPPFHMDGFDKGVPTPATYKMGGVGFPMGHILHDYLEARVMPRIIGPTSWLILMFTPLAPTSGRAVALSWFACPACSPFTRIGG